MKTDQIIVLAKVDMTGTRETGEMIKRDGNFFRDIEPAPRASALVYSSDLEDTDRGQALADKEGWWCWIMDNTDDVLQIAREKALDRWCVLNGLTPERKRERL